MLHLPKFRAGYDFLLLREQAGEDCQQLGQWWTEYQTLDEHHRQQMLKELEQNQQEVGANVNQEQKIAVAPDDLILVTVFNRQST